MKLIIGLGNPGKEYERTRHNVGFMAVDRLNAELDSAGEKFKTEHNAAVVKGMLAGRRVILAKPQTFMNDSGSAVQTLLAFYKLTPADLVVIHDDKDIPLGETRVQFGRGSAGHNGVQSIFDRLGTKDFTRIRVGVAFDGKPILDTGGFVLGKLTKEEQKILDKAMENIDQEIKSIIKG